MRSAFPVGIALCLVFSLASIAESARPPTNDIMNESSGVFQCPDQCQACCKARWVKTFIGGFGYSDERFKCTLKAGWHWDHRDYSENDFPAGRSCSKPKQRNGELFEASVECDFTEDEKVAKASEELVDKCLKGGKCCCNAQDQWVEDVCFDMGTTSPFTHATSANSKVNEKYQRLDQYYFNEENACQNAKNRAVQYQPSKSVGFTTTGCCLRTEVKTKRERYAAGQQCTGVPPARRCSTKYETRIVSWTACAEWETLFYCSQNNGVTQSGQLYTRVSSTLGSCVTDRASDAAPNLVLNNGRCPSGYTKQVDGRGCTCPGNCGQSENY